MNLGQLREKNLIYSKWNYKNNENIGKINQSYIVHSHLGDKITYNDTVLWYDLEGANIQDDIDSQLIKMSKDWPDVVTVRKYFPKMRRKVRKRYWKLDHLPKDTEQMDIDEEAKLVTKSKKSKKERSERKEYLW
jgi:hypothetical protein